MPQCYKPKDCQHPSKVFGSTSSVSIGDLADEQLASPHSQNELGSTHLMVLLCRGTIYPIYVNVIGDFNFSVRGPEFVALT
jgi:hypothetical protein